MSSDSGQIREQVLYLHRQGMKSGDIARALDISKQMVSYHKKDLGLQLPRFKVTPALKDEMKFLLDEGCKPGEVARRLGVTTRTIYRLFPKPKKVVNKIKAVEEMLEQPVNRFLAMPWTSGEEIETVLLQSKQYLEQWRQASDQQCEAKEQPSKRPVSVSVAGGLSADIDDGGLK